MRHLSDLSDLNLIVLMFISWATVLSAQLFVSVIFVAFNFLLCTTVMLRLLPEITRYIIPAQLPVTWQKY